eukprot:2088692-Rhodomonas_salina.3
MGSSSSLSSSRPSQATCMPPPHSSSSRCQWYGYMPPGIAQLREQYMFLQAPDGTFWSKFSHGSFSVLATVTSA